MSRSLGLGTSFPNRLYRTLEWRTYRFRLQKRNAKVCEVKTQRAQHYMRTVSKRKKPCDLPLGAYEGREEPTCGICSKRGITCTKSDAVRGRLGLDIDNR